MAIGDGAKIGTPTGSSSSGWSAVRDLRHRLICSVDDTLMVASDEAARLLQAEGESRLKARLRGGILSRARRGELKQMVPVGFVHDAQDRVILDPDAQVQASVRLFFETFQRIGSCLAVVKEFHAKGAPVFAPIT